MTCPNLGLRLGKTGPIPWDEAVQCFLVEICLGYIIKVFRGWSNYLFYTCVVVLDGVGFQCQARI